MLPVRLLALQLFGRLFAFCGASMLLNGGVAVSQVRGFRMCWLPGRFGAGKSAVSFRLAYELADLYGYRIVSNQENVWNEPNEPQWIFDEYGNMTLRLILIIDECGIYLQDEQSIMSFLAFAGKMDVILMAPSITEPAAIVQSLSIQPMYNFRSAGIPVNVYQWRVALEKARFEGNFAWLGMEEIYGTYSTLNPSADPRGLVYFLRQKVQEYRAFFMERQKIASWQENYVIASLAEEELHKATRGRRSTNGVQTLADPKQIGVLQNAVAKIQKTAGDVETLATRIEKGNINRRGWGR